MSTEFPLMTSLVILAATVRAGAIDNATLAESLDQMASVVGRTELECLAHRRMNETRRFHRALEDQAMKKLHEMGSIPETPPFQPIKTAQDLKADNVTPFRPRGPEKT